MILINKLLIITIGESPRDDIAPILEKYLSNVEIVQTGLLDNLNKDEMKLVTNVPEDEKTLVSRKNNGEAIILNGKVIEERLKRAVIKATEIGHENILLLCTGEFDEINQRNINLFIPDKIITPLIANMFPDKKMGLLIPSNSQINMMNNKWGNQGLMPYIESASPYSSITEIIKSCESLERRGMDFILMDCMGYTEHMKQEVKQKVNIPVVLSNSLLIKILTEIL